MMTIEEKAKAYDEALNRAKDSYGTGAYDDATTEFIFPELSESEDRKHTTQGVLNAFNKNKGGEIINSKNKPSRDALLESAKKLLDGCNEIWWSDEELKKAILKNFPELAESEDEKIRKAIISYLYNELNNFKQPTPRTNEFESWLSYLEKKKDLIDSKVDDEDERIRKAIQYAIGQSTHGDNTLIDGVTKDEALALLKKQKEQKPEMIHWTGDNLKDVIDFTGKSQKVGEWFKSWDEYEEYVHSHNDILKLFCDDGSHYEVPKGAWIVKTPDGYNVASRSKFIQNPAEWSEADEYRFELLIAMCEDEQNESSPISTKYCEMQGTKDWLENRFKSLRPQPKQEWSEEDEKRLNRISWYLTHKGYNDDADWLKSLLPSWNPSEE